MIKVQNTTNTLIAVALPITLILCAWCYWNGLNGIFLLDDTSNITPTLMENFSFDQLLQIASSNNSGMFRRPIPTVSFSFTSLFHGPSSWGFKYHNLLIHLLTGISVFILATKLFGITLLGKSSKNIYVFSLIVMLTWLFHPLHVSTVLYSVQRMTQFSALFTFLSLISLISGLQSLNTTKKLIWLFFAFPICLILGLLSKENAALIPVLSVLIYIYCAKHIISKHIIIDRLFLFLFAITPIILGFLLFTYKADSILDYSSRDFDMRGRLLSQIDFISLYLKQLLLPKLSQMGLYFDDYVAPSAISKILFAKLSFLILLLVTSIYQTVKGQLWGLGIALFFFGHALESTLLPLEIAFEHRNYLPSFGVFITVVDVIRRINISMAPKLVLIGLWFGLLCTLLILRVDFWNNRASWQQTTLAFHPLSERTRLNYIYGIESLGKHELALQEIKKSFVLIPEEIAFPIMYLSASCLDSMEEDNIEIIDGIYNHLNNKNLTIMGFNALAALTRQVVRRDCTSIHREQVSNIVDTAARSQEAKMKQSRTLGYLKILQAKFFIHQGMTMNASELYMEAYRITGDANEVFSSAKTLILAEDTRASGLLMLDDIKNNQYFNSSLFRHEISRIEAQLEDENYTFKF